jgi:ribosomal protein S18 acetylase RimI-like enzyme
MAVSRSRPYASAADLRKMQAAVARAYPVTSLRVGDLAWLTRYHTHRELSLDIRLWQDDTGEIVGWTYVRSFGGFNVFVAPGHADAALLDEMLAEIDAAERTSVAAGDPPVARYTYGVDLTRSVEDRALAAALERHGFTASPTIGGVLTRALDDVPEPSVPAGYRLGWVNTREHAIGRVEAQRAAFAPSNFTVERYEQVRRTWPYRASLDRIVLTDDGAVVAFCTAWLDEENAAGLFEPVGTHPAHQRRGLARAVCTDALRVLRAAGARTAQVGCESDAACAAYRDLGFEYSAADGVYRRAPA